MVTIASVDHSFAPPVQQRNIRITGMTERPAMGLKSMGLQRATFDASYAQASQTVSPISWSSAGVMIKVGTWTRRSESV